MSDQPPRGAGRACLPTNRSEALVKARRLMRGFRSAPEPIKQAWALQQALAGASGFRAPERVSIEALGRLLEARSSILAVEAACRGLIRALPLD